MPTVTVDVSDWASKARLRCPDPKRAHTSWRPQEENFYCKKCRRTYDHLVDAKTGKPVARDEVQVNRGR